MAVGLYVDGLVLFAVGTRIRVLDRSLRSRLIKSISYLPTAMTTDGVVAIEDLDRSKQSKALFNSVDLVDLQKDVL